MNDEGQATGIGIDTGETGGAPGPAMQRGGPGPGLMGATTLIGNDVYNNEGEDLGAIKEIMLDMSNGNISYAVLSFSTFLGMGAKLFAVPWSALTLDTENKRFVLNTEKDRLRRAPGFHKDQWPNMADQSWEQEIHRYYGTKLPSACEGTTLQPILPIGQLYAESDERRAERIV